MEWMLEGRSLHRLPVPTMQNKKFRLIFNEIGLADYTPFRVASSAHEHQGEPGE